MRTSPILRRLPAALLLLVGAVTASATASTQTTLTASDAHSYQYLGYDVDLSGDTAIVGAHENDGVPNAIEGPGAAYIFQRSTSGWTQQAKLVGIGVPSGSWFGFSVAISGDRAVVGAPYMGPGPSGTGRAFVFKRTGSTWAQEAELTAGDLQLGDQFGYAVHIDGDRVGVGAPWGMGGVYLYDRIGSQWVFDAKLAPATGLDFAAQFGQSLCIDFDRVAVGAPGLDFQSYDSGAAYVFERSGNAWTQTAFLPASDGTVVTAVGTDVDLQADVLIVGSHNDGAYVFERNAGMWSETTKLTSASNAWDFGAAVALDGDDILVGGSGANSDQGEVIPYTLSGGQWMEQAPLVTSGNGQLGKSVALDNKVALAGSPYGTPAGTKSGAAYAVQIGPPGTFTNLGNGLAGSGPAPILTGSGTLFGGCPVSFQLSQAAPNASAWLVYGLGALNAPFYGGTLVPDPAIPGGVLALGTNGLGGLNLATNWPIGLPSGTQLYLQYWITDVGGPFGLSASNGLRAQTP